MAVPRRRRDRRAAPASRRCSLTRGEHRLGIREGFLVVALTWLVAAALGALPYILSGDPQLDRPLDAYFEGMSGFTHHRRQRRHRRRGAPARARDVAPADAVVRRHRDHRARAGRAAAAARRRPAAARARDARPGDRDAEHAIRDTARRVWILYIALTATLFAILLGLGLSGADEEMTPFQAFAHALTTIPTAGFSTKAARSRTSRRDPVGGGRLHDPRRDQLRAHVPRARPAAAAGGDAATKSSGCTSPCSCSARSCS